jgi:hypothetical protein
VTPSLGALRSALCSGGLLLILAAGAVHPSYAAEPTPRADTSHAGSLAGEGRERPGRRPAPTSPTSPDASRQKAADEGDDAYEEQDAQDTETAADTPTGTGDTGDTGETGDTDTGSDPAVPDRSEATAAPEPSQGAATPAEQNAVRPATAPQPMLRILPLGSGLILIGLGLGLAFVALRVRRG